MKWYKDLYCGASIRLPRWVKYQILYKKKAKNYFCIALSDQGENLLDIYESRFLKIPGLNSDPIFIIGIAADKEEAFEVVRQIIQDVYTDTHGFDIKRYLEI